MNTALAAALVLKVQSKYPVDTNVEAGKLASSDALAQQRIQQKHYMLGVIPLIDYKD